LAWCAKVCQENSVLANIEFHPMIDVHVHVVPPNLPGVGSLSPTLELAPPDRVMVLRRALQEAGVQQVLAMGSCNGMDEDPLGISLTQQIASQVPGLHPIGVADPTRSDREFLKRVEAALAAGQVKALKGYLGYLHHAPDDAGYRPFYELCARYSIPFVFHTGDTYSPRAKLRFAHPLLIDDVAVDHPEVRFVMAHCGNPWLTDAAEVVYKNMNVWVDLSGLAIGTPEDFCQEERQEQLRDLGTAVLKAFQYAERPNRFLYGSDWPLAPMLAYRDWIRTIIPELYHPLIFDENARALFRL
jgi:predicted TIM-barrel fold metal-dependent hydrolase